MHSPAVGAEQPPKGNRIWTAGKIGQHKPVPPEKRRFTTGATGWLGPWEKPAKQSDFLDGYRNRKYQ